MTRVAAIGGVVVLVALGLLACSSGSSTGSDHVAVDAVEFDAPQGAAEAETVPAVDGSSLDGSDTPPDAAEIVDIVPPPAWVLPPCYRACDRVTACGVAACLGYDWASAGTLFESCYGACDEAWAAAVLAAPACPDVEAAAASAIADYTVACTTNPCDPACASFAACVVGVCEALEPSLEADVASDCHAWCTPASSVWMVETPCADLVTSLAQGDPVFSTACHGAATSCAGPELCEPWAAKVAGCIVAHCAGNADPYQDGLALLLGHLCQHDPKCPAVADVQAGLDPAVTCDTPGFDTLGRDAPFTALCDGTVGVTPAQVGQACELLATCPGAEWLGGPAGCGAFLVLTPSAPQRTECLLDAVDCTGAYACLEGL